MGPIEVQESVVNSLKTITSATAAHAGKFLNYTGEEFPW
jgi:hypothetical protein